MTIHVLELVASAQGGGATHVRDLATALPRERFSVEVMMPADGGAVDARDFATAGIACHTLALDGVLAPAVWGRLRSRMMEADVVHAHGARAAFHARLAAASLGRGRPGVVYTLHGWTAPHRAQPRRAVALALERTLDRLTDRVIAVCDAEHRAYAALIARRDRSLRNGVAAGGSPANRDCSPHLLEMSYGIAVERFAPEAAVRERRRETVRAELGLDADSFVVLTACRLARSRDFETLLGAFSRLHAQRPGSRLVVAGDGPYRGEIERGAAAARLPVTLLGWRRDLAALHAASDLFVLGSQPWEGVPFAVLEAMASGLAVVATDSGGTGEAVRDGETGLLAPPHDVQRLGDAMLALAADPGRRAAFGRRARERVASEFGLDSMIERIAELYDELAAIRASRPHRKAERR